MHRYHTCVHVLRTIRSTSNGMLWKKQKEPRKRTGQFEWNTMQWNAMERKIKCANISNIIGKCSTFENMGNVIVAIFCTCICHTHTHTHALYLIYTAKCVDFLHICESQIDHLLIIHWNGTQWKNAWDNFGLFGCSRIQDQQKWISPRCVTYPYVLWVCSHCVWVFMSVCLYRVWCYYYLGSSS